MIAKPTTEQILNECGRELIDVVLPAVTDETVKVAVMMMSLVLRNAAVRAAHEIAWMAEEIDELEVFPNAAIHAPPASLHLDDVVERYRQASEAFSDVMEAAVAAADDDVTRQGRALLARRVDHEQEVLCGWSPVGR
jgi:hypothetical protein